jgi:hypothetical protein
MAIRRDLEVHRIHLRSTVSPLKKSLVGTQNVVERDCDINADFAMRYLGYLDVLAVQRSHRFYPAILAQRCNRGCGASPLDTSPLRG